MRGERLPQVMDAYASSTCSDKGGMELPGDDMIWV
jgi:hypothetical protein